MPKARRSISPTCRSTSPASTISGSPSTTRRASSRFGETTTYGELAKLAGHAGLPRETGQALGANPVPLVIPCHRILAAGGKIGGFSAPGGSTTKEKMLALEGVRVGPPPAPQQSFGF